MIKTQSEKWFEEFCNNAGLNWHRIAEEDNKTPDYQIDIDNQIIIVEIKEFSRNKDEQRSDRLLEERGYGEAISNTPGDRVRKKIRDSSAQIKARTHGVCPGVLILCDIKYGCGQITGHTEPYNIRVGMYGLEQIHLSVPKDPKISPYATGISYGPKRKMTTNQNTTFSAIGVLSTPSEHEIRLDIYHNLYASQPLDPKLIVKHGVRQFHLVAQGHGMTAQWQEIET